MLVDYFALASLSDKVDKKCNRFQVDVYYMLYGNKYFSIIFYRRLEATVTLATKVSNNNKLIF